MELLITNRLLLSCTLWVPLTLAATSECLFILWLVFQTTIMNTDVAGSEISPRIDLAHWSCVDWTTLIFHYLIHARLFLLVCLSAGCLLNWWMDFYAYWGAVRLLAKEQLIKCWWGSRCCVSSNETNDCLEGLQKNLLSHRHPLCILHL